MRWTRKSIIAEINRLHDAGEQLNYSAAEGNHLNLVRAAAWHYGTWRHAVESAGVNYESLSRYQRWNKARIVERINELHKQEQDLSWRAVSTEVDPPLAAAALRVNGFKSWRDALAAAGIDVDKTARYQYWDEAKVIKAIRARKRAGEPMSSKSLQKADQCLFCAARRRFGSWDAALAAAGLNVDKIRLRRHNSSLNAPRSKKEVAVAVLAAKNGKVAAPKAVPKAIKAPVAKPVVAKAASKPTASKAVKAATLQLSLEMPAAKPKKGSATKATTKAVATKAPAKSTASKAARAAAPQLPLDMPAAKPAAKVSAKAPAKKAAVSPNGKATTPVKITTKAAPVKSTAKKVATKAAPVKKVAVKATADKKAPAKKAAVKATSAKAASTSKTVAQSIARKGPAVKAVAKIAKKNPVAKPAVAKAAGKKVAVAKPAATKAAVKKAVVAKPAAKKPVATKTAAKKSPAKRATR